MTTKDEALRIALRALEEIDNHYMALTKRGHEAVAAIKQAQETHASEAVTWTPETGYVFAAQKQAQEPVEQRCQLCKYEYGHSIGCENNPVDIALKSNAEKHKPTGWVAPVDRYAAPVMFNPYTGEPRDVRDVQSDPQGILIVPIGHVEMLAAAPKQAQEPVAELTEQIADIISSNMYGVYHCTRVWEAWSVGTMGEDDFESYAESDSPLELAELIVAALKPAPKQAEPEGYKLVPVEPTQEMCDAARWSEYGEETSRQYEVSDDFIKSVWDSLLAAAPTPQEAK